MVSFGQRAAIIALLSTLLPAQAFALCSEPSPPRFYASKPNKPSTPFCVNEFSRTHTCSDWEISRYNSDVESYNRELDRYRSAVSNYRYELDSYVRSARDYAQCESDRR